MNKFILNFIITILILAGSGQAGEMTPAPEAKTTNKKEAGKVKEHKSGEWSPMLDNAEKETLFAITTATLEWCVKGGEGSFSFDKYTITPKLKVPTHTFVTLKIKGGLRGCIGSLPPMSPDPLCKSVHENAINAASRDYRFPQVTERELKDIDVHISLLSPVKAIASLDEFIIGKHGIIFRKGRNRSVFLPEVAVEQNWTKEDTLTHLSMKAGLEQDAWRSGAEFEVFESVVLMHE